MKKIAINIVIMLIANTMSVYASKQIEKTPPKEKYFLVDFDNDPNILDYKLNHVELNGKQLYGSDKNVELFNLLSKNNNLILFSVLPNSKKNETWVEIDTAIFNKGLMDWKQLNEFRLKSIQAFVASFSKDYEYLKRNDVYLVKKEKGKYFVAKNCITEFFFIENFPRMFAGQTDIASININMPFITVKDFEISYKELYKEPSPNFENKGISLLKFPLEKPLLFLSKTLQVNNKKTYQFWSFMDWSINDSPNYRRGIDRFIFMPQIGIVGGSFDFYFNNFLTKNKEKEFYLNEAVMYPSKINGIPVVE